MEYLPGNPYHFEGSEQYFMNLDMKRKSFYDGVRVGKELYTKKRESIGECPICMDKIDEGYVSTDCGHTLCLSCFNNTLSKLNNNCPLCRSVMVTGVVSSRKLDMECRETYHNGYGDGYGDGFATGYEEGVGYMDRILKVETMRLSMMRLKYTKLKAVYNGTVRQLQNTNTLNFKQKSKEGTLFRTNSFDSYLKV
jgi:hypothetical protein